MLSQPAKIIREEERLVREQKDSKKNKAQWTLEETGGCYEKQQTNGIKFPANPAKSW